MSPFRPDEIANRPGGERLLGGIARVSADGTPHVVPVGYRYNPELDTVEVGGKDPGATKHFRDVRRSSATNRRVSATP